MAPVDPWDDDDDRRREPPRESSRSDYDRDYLDAGNKKSVAVTFLAVIHLLMGGVVLVCGLCGFFIVSFFSEAGQLGGLGLPGIGGGKVFTILFVVFVLGWGTGAIVSGVGLINRSAWSRLLSLILGVLAGAVGLLYLVAAIMILTVQGASENEKLAAFLLSFGGAVLFLGHCIWSYAVLLQPRYAGEFH